MFDSPNFLLNRRNRYQLLVTLVVNIITFSHGIGLGWLSPILRKLQSVDSPLDFRLDIIEVSWVGSILGIGAIIGNVFVGFCLERFGRKFCIYTVAIPQICSWILIYSAQSVEYLYVGRLLGGIASGGAYSVMPIYISEIADTNIRGTLSSLVMLSVTTGTLVGFILATYLNYHVIPFIAAVLPISYFLLNCIFPETPHYLIRKGKYEEAEKSFSFYKNIRQSKGDIEKSNLREFEELKIALTKGQNNNNKLRLKDFVTRKAMKAYGLTIVLIYANQFSGLFSFINYMSDIFALAKSTIDPDTCTIIIGVVQIMAVLTTTILVDIYGRKILMLISTLGVAVSLMVLAAFTYYSQSYDLSAFGWLPLLLISIDIFLGNIGLIALIWVVMVEVYPSKIRAIATPCSVLLCSLATFIALKIFPIFMNSFGIPLTMLSCSLSSLFAFVYFFLFLEETKGKSMVDN